MLLAPLLTSDSDEVIRLKMRLVAKYADIFLARRYCNFRNSDYNTLQYNVFTVVRDIRGKAPEDIAAALLHGHSRKSAKRLRGSWARLCEPSQTRSRSR